MQDEYVLSEDNPCHWSVRQVSQEHQKQVQVEVASQTRNIQHDSVENHIQHKPDETRVKARDDQKVISNRFVTPHHSLFTFWDVKGFCTGFWDFFLPKVGMIF